MNILYRCYSARFLMVASLLITVNGQCQEDSRIAFEAKYHAWRSWVTNHQGSSDLTINKEYNEMIKLGIPALPFIMERIETNHADFHLFWAVDRITRKRFDRTEWPKGKLADSVTASKMYLNWWKNDRQKTPELFNTLYQSFEQARAEKDPSARAAIGMKIMNLGIASLLDLIEKARNGDVDTVQFISKLTDGNLAPTATATDAVSWWERNKNRWLLPDN